MTVYRITEFTSPTPDKIAAACEAITETVAKAGADMIDIVMMDGGKGVVIAKYGSKAAMDSATIYNKQAFGELVTAGVVEGGSIASRTGDKVFSF